MENLIIAIKGFSVGISLIMPIGVQNAFILKQGILRNYRLASALTCGLLDSMLIIIGVAGIGIIISQNPILLAIAKWGGAAFLTYYGSMSLKDVFKKQKMDIDSSATKPSLSKTILMIAGVSLLNPHAILDTVVLMGSIGGQYLELEQKFSFIIGASSASIIWFLCLAFGSTLLTPLFKKTISWQILNAIIAALMYFVAGSLIMEDIRNFIFR